MMGVEERLANVEGLVGGHGQLLGDLRTAVASLEGRIDRRFDHVDTRFTQIDGRFAQIEGRITGLSQTSDVHFSNLDRKIDTIEQKLDAKIDALDRKLEAKIDALDKKLDVRLGALDQKLDTKVGALDQKLDGVRREMMMHFRWTMGALVTIVAVFLGAVLSQ